MDVQLADNNGNMAVSGMVAADPVAAGGIWRNAINNNIDNTVTVEENTSYIVTAIPVTSGGMVLGLADVLIASNVIWVVSAYESIIIRIPRGFTTLHYTAFSNAEVEIRLRKL